MQYTTEQNSSDNLHSYHADTVIDNMQHQQTTLGANTNNFLVMDLHASNILRFAAAAYGLTASNAFTIRVNGQKAKLGDVTKNLQLIIICHTAQNTVT